MGNQAVAVAAAVPMRKPDTRVGRVRSYSQQAADIVIERIAEGMTLREVVEAGGVPGKREISAWIDEDHEGFGRRYARARLEGYDSRAERLMELARSEEDVQRAKLLVDTEKWLLSKLSPKKYGDRLTLAGDEDAPLHHQVTAQVAALSVEQRAQIERLIGGGTGEPDDEAVQALPKPEG